MVQRLALWPRLPGRCPVSDAGTQLRTLVEATLRVVWLSGDVTRIGTHTTGWRSLPGTTLVENLGLRARIERRGEPTIVAEPGSAIVLDENIHHRIDSTEVGVGVARWGHASFRILGGVSVLSLFDVPVARPPPRTAYGDLLALLAEFHRCDPPPSPIERAVRGTTLGLRLLDLIIDGCPANARAASLVANLQRLAPVLTWIDEHLDQPASRAALARLAGLSASRFHELFLTVMREPPMAYLASRRMQRAQQLLIGGTCTVNQVAAAVGFADPFHFSRVFKRAYGTSPARWRSQVESVLDPRRGGM